MYMFKYWPAEPTCFKYGFGSFGSRWEMCGAGHGCIKHTENHPKAILRKISIEFLFLMATFFMDLFAVEG